MPWDCSDWTAYVHDDRTTAILETLAENRGKALYCGIDQSDTFTKAETWAAGKDRNERDDTVYFGENGNFRGFIAAQEGWLTEGESGITGQSTATIFEFPKEPRRGWRTKRIRIGNDPAAYPITAIASCGQVGGILCQGDRPYTNFHSQRDSSIRDARKSGANVLNTDFDTNWEINWQTQAIHWRVGGPSALNTVATPSPDEWQAMADAAAEPVCRARGYRLGRAAIGPGHNNDNGSGNLYTGLGLGWFLESRAHQTNPALYSYRARQSRTWTATCIKRVRR